MPDTSLRIGSCAGVGNWVADEILFHAGLHPLTVASSLSDAEIELVRKKMLYVCQTAVGVGADSSQFPPGWLMRHRWGKGKKKGEGEPFVLVRRHAHFASHSYN